MQTRGARLTLLLALLVAGIAAGLLTWDTRQRTAALLTAELDVVRRLDAMIETSAALLAAQQAYVVPGQPDAPWLERASALMRSLGDDAGALATQVRSAAASGRLLEVQTNLADVGAIDTRVREQLDLGQELLAADVVFAESRDVVTGIGATLSHLRGDERAAFAAARVALERRSTAVLGGVALFWLIGLGLLVRVPTAAARGETHRAPDEPVIATTTAEPRVEASPAPPPPVHAGVDLDAAARVCAGLSAMSSTVELPDLLARAAAVVEATGLIVWLGRGHELFAAASYGYDPRVISRLGTLGRDADNATAACWRSGEVKAVAGDMMTAGAIVAPLVGPDGCIGVLAAEVGHGRESDPGTRAVLAIMAAQLATVVGGHTEAAAEPLDPATRHVAAHTIGTAE